MTHPLLQPPMYHGQVPQPVIFLLEREVLEEKAHEEPVRLQTLLQHTLHLVTNLLREREHPSQKLRRAEDGMPMDLPMKTVIPR